MTVTAKQLKKLALSTVLTLYYTAPALTTSYGTQFWLANTDTQNDKTVFIGDGATANNVIVPSILVPKGKGVVIDAAKIVLQAAGVIYARVSSRTSGTSTAGAAATITLQVGSSAVDSYYVGQVIETTGGTGANQSKIITGYVGATRVATVESNWSVNPDATTTYNLGELYMTLYGVEEV